MTEHPPKSLVTPEEEEQIRAKIDAMHDKDVEKEVSQMRGLMNFSGPYDKRGRPILSIEDKRDMVFAAAMADLEAIRELKLGENTKFSHDGKHWRKPILP